MNAEEAYEAVDTLRDIANRLEVAANMRNLPRDNLSWISASEWHAVRSVLARRTSDVAKAIEGHPRRR